MRSVCITRSFFLLFKQRKQTFSFYILIPVPTSSPSHSLHLLPNLQLCIHVCCVCVYVSTGVHMPKHTKRGQSTSSGFSPQPLSCWRPALLFTAMYAGLQAFKDLSVSSSHFTTEGLETFPLCYLS